MSIFPIDPLRKAFLTLPKQPRQSDSEPIDIKNFYVPFNHAKALHSTNLLIEGGYGTGKTEWFLQLSKNVTHIAHIAPHAELNNTHCSQGYGQVYSSNYPSKDSFTNLLKYNISPELIWKTIIAFIILDETEAFRDCNWNDKINVYQDNTNRYELELRQREQELSSQQKKHLILFDALNYASDDWETLKKLLKGLFQAALTFRSFRAIHLKIFVRPDMLEDNAIYSFTGGIKIMTNKLPLEWHRLELFNLLWQYLGNAAEGGEEFRNGCEQHFKQVWKQLPDTNSWLIPDEMRKDETVQRAIFHALTGERMGNKPHSGYPYVWLPNHLEDSFGKISPCSFLTALHEAANSDALQADQNYPLNALALKKGLQKASEMQVATLNEKDYWINTLFKGKAISFPCEFSDINEVWQHHDIRQTLRDIIESSDTIPPVNYVDPDFFYEGIKKYLISLGIFQQMLDGRINMPDIYRIGYGLGRKGGIKSVK